MALALVGLLVFLRVVRRRRAWLGAFLEQARREVLHPLEYREDQRVRAIQQRLSRVLGRKALGEKTGKRIAKELRHGLDD